MNLTTTVRTREGRRFEAPVANLTPNTLFVRTAQPLAFRDVLELSLLGHSIRAVVIFACELPRGAVLWFESPEPVKEAVLRAMPQVPVEAPVPVDADAWREITNTESEYPLDDRVPLEDVPTPFDTTSSSVSDSEELEAAWSDVSVVSTEEDLETVTPADLAAGGIPGSSQLGEIDPTGPASVPPAYRTGSGTATSPAVSPQPELPLLERDGCTVRFTSIDNYREQFETHLTHGGLVVAAEPMPVGTQRMLLLAVPGARAYTVSARVVFNQPGVVGFMLDSFGLHRDKLKSLLR